MLNGIDMARDPIAAKRSFGYVPDSFDMYERLTGMDYPQFHGGYLRSGRCKPQAPDEKYLSLFELEDAANRQIAATPRHIKQASPLPARSSTSHIWVLDEP